MTRRLIIRRLAGSDIRQASRWYEQQVDGMGAEFVEEIDAAFERIRSNPERFKEVYPSVRRGVSHSVSLRGVFWFDDKRIVVFAVIHGHRNPDLWRERAEDELRGEE